jgi:DNA-binding XRE family transcriptional regulator
MDVHKKKSETAGTTERLSRNPRPSRQSKTLSGKPLYRAARRLEELRAEIGVSQPQLARTAGVPASAIANVETDRYALSARYGIDIYTALARIAPPDSPQYREAKREAAGLIAFQEELDRKMEIDLQGQRVSLEKKYKELERRKADVKSKKARLKEAGSE